MQDGFLSVNKFSEPVVIDSLDAAQVMILRLILLEKGTIQSHPDMGVGILTQWRYRNSDDLDKLKLEIEQQIETYIPPLAGSEVLLSMQEKQLIVKVIKDNIVYGYKLDESAGTFMPIYE